MADARTQAFTGRHFEAEVDPAGELFEKNDAGSGERTADFRTTAALRDALSRSQAIDYWGFLAMVSSPAM